jgi:uncharacterized protein YndB with AHSA1/START domain/uncharacterized protein YciI
MAKEAQAIADVEQGLVLATVEIAAAPERVFEALVRAEDVLRWWGSDEFHRTTEWVADLRPGGSWRAGGHMKDGRPYKIEGEFREVEPPHKLVFTWRPDWDAPHETLVTYLLEPLEQGTRLTLRHEGFTGRADRCRTHTQGWTRVLGWLQADLRPQPAPPHYFLFRLLPPRPSFIRDITAEEMAIMQAHSNYWRGKLAEGKIVAFGPVADPKGSWGVGILRLSDASEADTLTSSDPAILANAGFSIEVLPMPRAVHV